MNLVCKFKVAFGITLTLFLSGCIVKSSQLTSLFNLIKEPSLDLSANSWRLRYSDYESVVYAISTDRGTLFSNKAGDQILFDGWMVREVSGLGRRNLDIRIDQVDGVRLFKQGMRSLVSHNCKEWQRETSSGIVKLSQNCVSNLSTFCS